MPPALMTFYVFAFGAIVGSFLNVVIHRFPLGESIVFPASRCPVCRGRIRPWDNVPILSFIWLRGRCRNCSTAISWRYPLIELANALFYVAVFQRTGLSFVFLPVAALVSMTIVLMSIDAEIQILPDVIDLPGTAIGLLAAAFGAGGAVTGLYMARTLTESVIGAVAGGGVLLVIGWTYQLVRRIEGMGLGDVKMMLMIGSVLGWQALLPMLTLASASGALTGIAIMVVTRRADMRFALPFGVFLGFSFLVILFFGEALFGWIPPLRLNV